jgi:formimidoylglutamate deiminase
MEITHSLHTEYKTAGQVTLGFAPHSLRAVSPDMLHEGVQAVREVIPHAPIHILVAADMQEVNACIEWSGMRPVAWLLENAGLDENWCLVHATNINDDETLALAASGAVTALCPSTEANMGAGIFPLSDYFAAGGTFAAGSGSNIAISPFEELRWMEYEQRLMRHERAVLTQPEMPSTGALLFEQCLAGGAQALGRKTGRLEAGYRADLLVIDMDLPCMTGKLRDHILDTIIFSSGENPVRDVMSGGRWAVKNRRHRREEQVLENFRKVMQKAGKR